MIFRPRIFISSTFTDNVALRDQIKEYLISIGAEPLLYERNLTPSTVPLTYRENVKDADFIIVIIKGNYGTITNSGLSGTHEEYRLATSYKIPMHVYLYREAASASTTTNPLIDDLKNDNVSFYYFSDDNDLLMRLKETTFTIAKEIMLAQIEKNNLPANTIFRLAGNYDYHMAVDLIKIIEGMKELNNVYDYGYMESNLILACVDPIILHINNSKHIFTNWKLYDLLLDLTSHIKAFIDHYAVDYTPNGKYVERSIPVLETVSICSSSYFKNTDWEIEDYRNELASFFEGYDKFRELVKNTRLFIDTL